MAFTPIGRSYTPVRAAGYTCHTSKCLVPLGSNLVTQLTVAFPPSRCNSSTLPSMRNVWTESGMMDGYADMFGGYGGMGGMGGMGGLGDMMGYGGYGYGDEPSHTDLMDMVSNGSFPLNPLLLQNSDGMLPSPCYTVGMFPLFRNPTVDPTLGASWRARSLASPMGTMVLYEKFLESKD